MPKDPQGQLQHNQFYFVLKNQELLEEFKQNAYVHAMGFDLPNILPLYEKIYEELSK